MDYEKENMQEHAEEQRKSNYEGYKPVDYNNQSREAMHNGRPQRPRIRTQKAYTAVNSHRREEEAFRPEGFGAGLQKGNNQQHGYKPRTNYKQNRYGQNNGGYHSRYNPNQQNEQGGYQYRQYNNNYNPGYNNPQQRTQNNYKSRQSYNKQGQNAQYGYGNNGYQQHGSFSPRQGKYQNNNANGARNNYQPTRQGYNPNAKPNMKKRIEYKEVNIDPNEPMRLNKFLANAGICSRREADEFIQAGVIKVNGEVVTELGTKILRTDSVVFHEQPVTLEKKVYVLLNKPKDYVTTSDDPQQRKTVMDLVKGACPERIYPVGRLDRNTTGVLLLTNDGELASKLTHPKFLKKKVYHVYLDKNLTAHDLHQIAEGITLDDGEIRADAIEYASNTDKSQVGIEIHSGKNRIVRRIFESLGYRVVKLDRVLFAGLTKKNVRRGDWRFLTEKEVDMLRMGAFE